MLNMALRKLYFVTWINLSFQTEQMFYSIKQTVWRCIRPVLYVTQNLNPLPDDISLSFTDFFLHVLPELHIFRANTTDRGVMTVCRQ